MSEALSPGTNDMADLTAKQRQSLMKGKQWSDTMRGSRSHHVIPSAGEAEEERKSS